MQYTGYTSLHYTAVQHTGMQYTGVQYTGMQIALCKILESNILECIFMYSTGLGGCIAITAILCETLHHLKWLLLTLPLHTLVALLQSLPCTGRCIAMQLSRTACVTSHCTVSLNALYKALLCTWGGQQGEESREGA